MSFKSFFKRKKQLHYNCYNLFMNYIIIILQKVTFLIFTMKKNTTTHKKLNNKLFITNTLYIITPFMYLRIFFDLYFYELKKHLLLETSILKHY